MATSRPLVSVIICVYNAGLYFRPSLLSILNQTYRELEILVVDDGSTDSAIQASVDLLRDPRVRLLEQPNRGKPAALNLALEHVHGDFYAVHDADDISDPTRIAAQAQCLQCNPDLAAVFCCNDLILHGRRMAPCVTFKDRRQCRREIDAFRTPAHDPTAMYRLSLVGHLRYDESLPILEGVDYILRVGEQFPMMVLGQCLYGYRIHGESVTRRDPHRRAELVRQTMQRACARRGLSYEQVFATDADQPANARRRRQRQFEDNYLAAHFLDSVWYLRSVGRSAEALWTGWQCAKLHPLDPHYYKPLFCAAAPTALIERIRGRARRPAVAPHARSADNVVGEMEAGDV